MLTMRGGHFARKLLEHEHAEVFSNPPRCGACRGATVDLRRRRGGDWYWRCYSESCPDRSQGGRKTWTKPALGKAQDRSRQRVSRPVARAENGASSPPTRRPPPKVPGPDDTR
jgi:hypothetical protein